MPTWQRMLPEATQEFTLCTSANSPKGQQTAKTWEQFKEKKKGGRGEEEQYVVISTHPKFFCTLLIKTPRF